MIDETARWSLRISPAIVIDAEGNPLARSKREDLTETEIKILLAAARGATATETAAQLGLSKETVRTHRKRIISKLGVANITEALARAIESGVIKPGDW